MPVRRINERTREFDLFAEALRAGTGKEPGDLGALKRGTVILGKFEGAKLAAFALFQPFLDPSLHIGSMIDPATIKRLEDLAGVALYNIGLIHDLAGASSLASSARELVGEFEKMLAEGNEDYCLLISLMRKANRKAFPLWRSLGFKVRGGESYYMSIAPEEFLKKQGESEKRWGEVFLKTFEEMDENDLVSLSRCYSMVFAANTGVVAGEHIRGIISKPSFLPGLSILVCDENEGGEVVGFCFIEMSEAGSVHISAAGLSEDFRGGDISLKGLSWIMENCARQGYGEARLVTASRKLRDVFAGRMCARVKDTLVWLIKCGAADG